MPKRIVIVGAVAPGPKAICRVRRLDSDAEIIMPDRDNLLSTGGCGIPSYMSGDFPDLEERYSTSSHVIRNADFFKTSKEVDIINNAGAEFYLIHFTIQSIILRLLWQQPSFL